MIYYTCQIQAEINSRTKEIIQESVVIVLPTLG